jgi:multicomponent Na+:H+ antiporter subunit B
MNNPIISRITTLVLPFIMMFSFYVQINGENAPGGGFQAGVLMASAFILYSLVFGDKRMPSIFALQRLGALGIALYGGIGVLCMLLGQSFLSYNALGFKQISGQIIGITVVEWGVGFTVFATITLIYRMFAGEE